MVERRFEVLFLLERRSLSTPPRMSSEGGDFAATADDPCNASVDLRRRVAFVLGCMSRDTHLFPCRWINGNPHAVVWNSG